MNLALRSFAPSAIGTSPDQATVTLLGALDRLEQVVDLETETLRAHKAVDLKSFNHRKSQGLLEVSRGMRAFESAPLGEPVRARLRVLRGKLEENRAVLAMHLAAMQEISAVIAQAMEEAESDGTYSARFR